MRILFVGMGGAITHEAFWALRTAGIEMVGVVKPFPYYETNKPILRLHHKKWWKRKLLDRPRLNTLSMCEIIPKLGIDVLEVENINHPDVLKWIRSLCPDLVCVASFPHLFTQALLAIPVLGCVNFHPSFLPDYRGPSPLFWMLKEGATQAGASVHFLDQGIDSGDLIVQQPISIPYGIRGRDLNQKIGEVGAPLLVKAVQDIQQKRVKRILQNTEAGSYHRCPRTDDYKIDSTQTASNIFHFAHGTARWMPLTYELAEHHFEIIDAVDFSTSESIPGEFLFHQGVLTVSCAGGIVRLKAK